MDASLEVSKIASMALAVDSYSFELAIGVLYLNTFDKEESLFIEIKPVLPWHTEKCEAKITANEIIF